VVDSGGVGGVETAEMNGVMMGWDGWGGLRVRVREGGGWRRLRAAGLGGREGRGWRWGGSWGRNGIQGVLAVPYIPVQGSPGVFRES